MNSMRKTQTKRKMYRKWRKKEKEEKRKMQKQENAAARGHDATMSDSAYHGQSKQSMRQPKNQNLNNSANGNPMANNQYAMSYPSSVYMKGIRQWCDIYNTAMQQFIGWNQHLQNRDDEEETYEQLLQKYAEEYYTSTEDEEEDNDHYDKDNLPDKTQYNEEGDNNEQTNDLQDNVDEEYLKFMEITYKHREELRLKREAN